MARIYKLKVPNENMISRIISSENQAHEIMVIDRSDKAFINTYIEKLEKPALYILVNRETDKLYIGETEDSIKRLRNHESKEFWTEAIVFHSKMNTLSTTEVRWLEAKTYEVVKDLGYFDLSENKVKPNYPPLKEDQDLELQPVFEEAKRYICAAGFDIFLKRGKSKDVKQKDIFDDDKGNDTTLVTTPSDNNTHTNHETWMICYDSKYFNVAECFKKYGQVYWRHKAGIQNIKKGDIVYLYGSSPESAIRFKAEVLESQIPYSKKMDVEDEFLISGDTNSDSENKRFFLVKYLAETYSAALKHSAMMKAGVMGKRPTATRLSQIQFKNLQEYIEGHFNDTAKDEKAHTSKPKKAKKEVAAKPDKRKSPVPPFKFSMIGLKPGDKVIFDALNLEVSVASENTVSYKNKEYKLTTFCKEFLPENMRTKTNTYRGSDFFSYKGKKLTKIRERK